MSRFTTGCEGPAIRSYVHWGIAIVRTEWRVNREMKARECLWDRIGKLLEAERRSAEKICMESDAWVGESRRLYVAKRPADLDPSVLSLK